MRKPYVTLTVCGSEYQLKITTAYAVKLEEQLGTDLLSGTDKLGELSTLSKYYYAALVARNDSIKTIEDVYQLIDDYLADGGTLEELQGLTLDILVVSGILTEDAREAQKKMTAELKAKMLEAFQKSLD
jgi:hypothetical protein